MARASLFLECARFVHRCNRGNWPEWMKGHHVNITKKGLSRGRSPIVGNKRNQKLQWNAAKHFCQWGDVRTDFSKHIIIIISLKYSLITCKIVSVFYPLRQSAQGSVNSVTRTARALQTSWVIFLMKKPNGE